MHGNVGEWCRDGYEERIAGDIDPLVPPRASFRVIRGGNWFDHGWSCRSAARWRRWPGAQSDNLGLRVVRVPSGS